VAALEDVAEEDGGGDDAESGEGAAPEDLRVRLARDVLVVHLEIRSSKPNLRALVANPMYGEEDEHSKRLDYFKQPGHFQEDCHC